MSNTTNLYQDTLDLDGIPTTLPLKPCPQSAFLNPHPDLLYFRGRTLRNILEERGEKHVFLIKEIADSIDFSIPEAAYKNGGRRPYHPRLLAALLVFVMTEEVSSLREIERFAQDSIRAQWLLGGWEPDHTTIAAFVLKHHTWFYDSFLPAMTKGLLAKLKTISTKLAADGTTIEAVSSRFNLLKAEARQEAKKAREEAKKYPNNDKLQEKADQLEEAANLIDRVNERNKSRNCGVAQHEPEAVNQRLKNSQDAAPAYKPSILVNEQRLILGHYVAKTSETEAIEPLLDQFDTLNVGEVHELLMDAGYRSGPLLKALVDRDINALIPSGRLEAKGELERKGPNGIYAVSAFTYDETSNTYRCPAGQTLKYQGTFERKGREGMVQEYQGSKAVCLACALRSKCTKSKDSARRVTRSEHREYQEAMDQVMRHPMAQKVYTKRMGRVEPVFSYLRGKLKLNRFRRRGLAKVRLDFGLAALGYNVNRVVRLLERAEEERRKSGGNGNTGGVLALFLRLLWCLWGRMMVMGRGERGGWLGGSLAIL